MSHEHTVASTALDVLAASGFETGFGIPGVHNLAIWNAESPDRPRIIGVRHEQAAGYACDALYRATGRPGAAFLTSGPGAANILAAFGEAYTAYSPMVVLSSDVGMRLRRPGVTRGILHEMQDQAAMFSAFGAHARNSASPWEAVANVVEAVARTLTAPSQPVYVGIPSDVLEAPWDAAAPEAVPESRRPVDDEGIAALADLLSKSTRVILWLGGGVNAAGMEESVRDLARRLGAVAVTSFAGRGLLAGDPCLIDSPVHEPEVEAVLRQADLLLVLGSDFDAMNTKNWRLPLPQRTAVVALGNQVENTIDWDVRVSSDLRDALPALEDALAERFVRADRDPWLADAQQIRGRVFERMRRDQRVASALALVDAVEAGWSQADAVVCDMAIAGFWVALYARQDRPRRAQYPVGWGTLGYGLPAAMGPASQGIATLCVCGDGGPMFALGELATYAQHSLPITLLVVDDGGYGMLRFDQQVFGHPERGVDLVTPDWVALAGSFGITGLEVDHPGQLVAALRAAREANARGEPRVLVWKQALYPPRTTSPRWFESG
ncbi:MAG: thiamine pyrophosphate-binding protein [Actinomycetes bacterium]